MLNSEFGESAAAASGALVKRPLSLRALPTAPRGDDVVDTHARRKVTIGCLMAVASIGTAEAQQSPLAPVQVEAPVTRKKPAATKPTAEQLRARNALRRAARAKQEAAANAPGTAAATAAPDANPYADPSAPYKADHL